jgi:hypothetical protein
VSEVEADLAQRFRDVAGLAGLLTAWVRYVESRAGRYTREAQRAVLGLLRNLKRPEDFFRATPYTPEGAEARLYEGEGPFSYGEAERLLQEAGAAIREGEDGRGRFLPVSREDLERVYAHLTGRYPGRVWRGFMDEVYKAAAARFPQYIGKDVRVWALKRLSEL